MTEERLKEIKDSIDLDYDFCRKFGFEFAKPQRELELYNEVIRLREIIDKATQKIKFIGEWVSEDETIQFIQFLDKYKETLDILKEK